MNELTLNTIPVGKACRVKKLLTNGSMRRRLLDLGLIEGTKVECLAKSPAGGMRAYFIRGAVIAIRNEDSKNILIET